MATNTVLLNIPVTLFASIFVTHCYPGGVCEPLGSKVRLVTNMPSVMCNFFNLVLVIPLVERAFNKAKADVLTTYILLKVVVLPAVVKIARSTVHDMPRDCCRNSLTLKTAGREDVFFIVLPTTGSNVLTTMMLKVNHTVNRAVTIMVITNGRPEVPRKVLGNIHAVATGVIARVNCTANLRERTLVTATMILFVFVLVVGLDLSLLGEETRRTG